MKRTGSRRAVLGAVGVGIAGLACGDPEPPVDVPEVAAVPAAPIRFVRAPNAALPGPPAPWTRVPFDAVSADMDLDGDPDLLLNWHHHGELELFENRGGRFLRRNPSARDPSGLDDNPGAPSLFVAQRTMAERIRDHGEPGLYLWHDPDRGGFWRFRLRDPDGRFGAVSLSLETTLRIHEVQGVAPADLREESPRRVRVALRGPDARFRVRTYPVGVRLALSLEAAEDDPPVFVGASLARFGTELALWKPDPHGIAWVDVEGSRHPEIAITRGGLGGRLVPPLAPKSDRYYRATAGDGEGEPLYRMAPAGFLDNGYGRGRRVEWVDADGDGSLDLSIANEQTPNVLLVRTAEGGLRDAAPALALDLEGAAVQAWGDLEPDGVPELFVLAGGGIRIGRRGADGRFAFAGAAAAGLALPPADPVEGLFDPAALHVVDLDLDGDLDLLVSGYGAQGSVHVFLARDGAFRDATRELGIAGARGVLASAVLDADRDGAPDLLCLAKGGPTLWRNEAGRRLRALPVGDEVGDRRLRVAAALDADADGRTDLVLLGRQRHLLYNRGGEDNRHLDVTLRSSDAEPIGAVVRAYYDDGRVLAQRYGSARSSAYSQGLAPLRYGVSAGRRIERLGVIWPGDATEHAIALAPSATDVVLERP